MGKEDKMLKEKKEAVLERKEKVMHACNDLLLSNNQLFKSTITKIRKSVSEVTLIPVKTLERSPYKELINQYRELSLNSENKDVIMLKKEIEYKNKLIQQLRKQIKAMETQLFMEDRI